MYNYAGERNIHFEWAQTKGPDGLQEYVNVNNLTSLDGLPTDIGSHISKKND